MIERCCDRATEFAAGAGRLPHAAVVNEVALNQVLVRFRPPQVSDLVQFHEDLAATVQREGRCWMGTSCWKGQPVLRFSASNWSTTAGDVQEALESLARALEETLHRHSSYVGLK
jgi:glutamate/tyrosine decarboxylase-like PLP-dependent enzyme